MKNSPDPYKETIDTSRGQYRYDPDYDCYYRVYSREDLTHWNQFGWIWVTAVLAIICYIATV